MMMIVDCSRYDISHDDVPRPKTAAEDGGCNEGRLSAITIVQGDGKPRRRGMIYGDGLVETSWRVSYGPLG